MSEDVFPSEHVYIPLLMLMEEIPNNHLGCLKPVVNWDIYHIHWLAGFLNHQQYDGKLARSGAEH